MSRLAAPPDAARWWPAAAGATSLRARVASADAALAAAFAAGEQVESLTAARAWVIEQAVLETWQRELGATGGLALLAVGGFGRGELFPRSDVDLLVLAEKTPHGETAGRVERFFARLWDEGLQVGHAVRTPDDCAVAAKADVTIATNLMEARRIDGRGDLEAAMRRATAAPDMWPADRFAAAKLTEQQARHARFHDTAYNLEPNLKEGPGGLRDVHTVLWVAQRQLGRPGLDAMREAGLIGPEEQDALVAARRALARIRFGLHLAARRPEERLLFEHQRELARSFGYADEHAQNLAVEQFMQGYYRAAMTVDRLNERLLQRLEEARTGEATAVPLDHEFCVLGGFLDTQDPALIERTPAAILRAFAALLDHPELHGFRSSLLSRLESVLPGLDAGFRADPAVQQAFLAILRHAGDVAGALQRMSRYGVLGRFLPAFGRVAGRMQYDLFHVYTVDQHTLFVLRNIRRFADAETARELPLAHELYARLRKPELLLLGGLFHDIAKGRGGDHSELGESDARAFCAQIGLSETDTDLVAWLVRQHLLMSLTSQKQDIADPAVVHRFAETVADSERLDYLYLLTVADIRATSPKLWNSWKDQLLAELHRATRWVLRRGLEHPVHASERVAETKQAALELLGAGVEPDARIEALWDSFPDDSFLRYRPDQIAWQTREILAAGPDALPLVAVRDAGRGTSEVFVHSPDRDGLFATITAVLDRFQLNVADARIVNSLRGISLDTFQVLEADGLTMRDPARVRQLVMRLRDELTRDRLELAPARRARGRRERQFHVPAQLEFSPVGERTQLALVCSDRPGLLAHVARAFRSCGLRVHDARIATFGERAEDFFLLSDEHDRPLDAERIAAVRAAVLAEIEDLPREHADRAHTASA